MNTGTRAWVHLEEEAAASSKKQREEENSAIEAELRRKAIAQEEVRRFLKTHYAAARKRARNWEKNERRKIDTLTRKGKLQAASKARSALERILEGFFPCLDAATSEDDYVELVAAMFERKYSIEETGRIARIMGCIKPRKECRMRIIRRDHVLHWMRNNNPIAFTEAGLEYAQRLDASGNCKKAMLTLKKLLELWKRSTTGTIKSHRASTLNLLRRSEGISPTVKTVDGSVHKSPLVRSLIKKVQRLSAQLSDSSCVDRVSREKAEPLCFAVFDILVASNAAFAARLRRRNGGKFARRRPKRDGRARARQLFD